MKELEKILEEIDEIKVGFDTECRSECDLYDWSCGACVGECDEYIKERAKDIIRKHMNNGWIPVEERLPEEKRANYEVTFINECGYEEHGFAQWYDVEFHIPAVVIAWRDHLNPYCPEKR